MMQIVTRDVPVEVEKVGPFASSETFNDAVIQIVMRDVPVEVEKVSSNFLHS